MATSHPREGAIRMADDAVTVAFDELMLQSTILAIADTALDHNMPQLYDGMPGTSMYDWSASSVLHHLSLLASYDGDDADLKALQPRASLALAEYSRYLQRIRAQS